MQAYRLKVVEVIDRCATTGGRRWVVWMWHNILGVHTGHGINLRLILSHCIGIGIGIGVGGGVLHPQLEDLLVCLLKQVMGCVEVTMHCVYLHL